MQTARKIDTQGYMQILRSYLMSVDNAYWTTQCEITGETSLTGVTVRQICQAYPAVFVSSTDGYKLSRYATRGEIQHCVSTLISRSEKMIHRAAALSELLT